MDHFGIGAGVIGSTNVYFQSARRTGRTYSLVESLKDGDRVIFTNAKEATRVERMCLERGVKIEVRVIPVQEAWSRVLEQGPAEGRAIFDHSWVEDYYKLALEKVERDIDHLQEKASAKEVEWPEPEWMYKECDKWRR